MKASVLAALLTSLAEKGEDWEVHTMNHSGDLTPITFIDTDFKTQQIWVD